MTVATIARWTYASSPTISGSGLRPSTGSEVGLRHRQHDAGEVVGFLCVLRSRQVSVSMSWIDNTGSRDSSCRRG